MDTSSRGGECPKFAEQSAPAIEINRKGAGDSRAGVGINERKTLELTSCTTPLPHHCSGTPAPVCPPDQHHRVLSGQALYVTYRTSSPGQHFQAHALQLRKQFQEVGKRDPQQ